MKKTVYKIVLLVFLVGINSCKKDYLTLENPNALSKDVYWENLDDADKGLTAVYSALLDHYVLRLDHEAMRSDEGFPGYPRPTGRTDKGVWYKKTYSATDQSIAKRWNAMYQVIFRANQVIEGLNKMEANIPEEDLIYWNHMMGQALFFRGLMHFYIHSTYNEGNIIIRDVVPQTYEDFNTNISPSEDVIAFFRNDLYDAYNLLPDLYLYEDETSVQPVNMGRATKGAAATILGTSFLYEATEGDGPNNTALIDSAVKYFEDVKDNYYYHLATGDEINQLFTIEGELGPESILEICYNLEYNPELSRWDENSMHNRWMKEMFANLGAFLPAWMAWAYKTDPMDTLDLRNKVADTLRTLSLRTMHYVALAEDVYTTFEGAGPTAENLAFGKEWGFGRCSKYAYTHEAAPEDEWESNKNVVVNRLSGVYIMLAECYLYQGKITESLELLNAIRDRWGLVKLGPSTDASRMFDGYDYASDPDSLMERIMYIESPLELIHEGYARRWINLRRWGVLKDRFADLAEQSYFAQNFEFINSEGAEDATSHGQVIPLSMADPTKVEDAQTNANSPHSIIDYEYDEAYANYIPEVHDWFPIPMQEEATNSALK